MITIDLIHSSAEQISVLQDYTFTLPQKRLIQIIPRTAQYRIKVRIANLQCPDLILRQDGEKKLITLQINGQYGSELELDVTGQKLHFNSLLNRGVIADCKEMESAENKEKAYAISYQVEYCVIPKKAGKEEWKTIPETFRVDVRFAGIAQEVNVAFNDSAVEYRAVGERNVKCGSLELSLGHLKRRATYLNMTFSLSVDGMPSEEIVHINNQEISETAPYAPESILNLRPDGTRVSALEFDYRPVEKQYHIGRYYVNMGENGYNRVTLPVMWDLSKIRNPRGEKEEYKLVMKGQVWSGEDIGSKTDFIREFPVTIMRNGCQTELGVYVTIPSAAAEGEKFPLMSGEDHTFGEVTVNGGSNRDFYFVVQNTADTESEPDAAVRIKDFKLSAPVYPQGIKLICGKDTYGNDITSPFDINPVRDDFSENELPGTLLNYPSEIANLRYGQMDTTCIRYLRDSIAGFTLNGEKCFETTVRFDFSFKYVVDADGTKKNPSAADFRSFSGSIILPLSVAPAPEWMCVDFGTSAVVAEYGKSIYDDRGSLADNLVDLRKKKTALLRKAIEEAGKRSDRNESDTKFISSLVSFNQWGNLSQYQTIPAERDFKDAAIWFSPSTGMIDPDYQLPCLKSLMGYESLPKGIFPESYENDLANTPASRVNTIYEIVYRQLFKYYVPKGIEKLVLSVPNTFAPLHLEKLRKIAFECIPTLRPSRLRFVSESDAVAYYYLSRRNSIRSHGNIPANERDNFDKHTVVYDMGAGTLDLTYFVKDSTPQSTTIEINGKIGVNKAGNYIDYLIAEIIVDLLKQHRNDFGKELAMYLELNKDNRNTNVSNQNCNRLKSYVRDLVKPALNDPDKNLAKLDWDENKGEALAGFTAKDIINHKKFQKFLTEITDDVFSSLAKLFGPGTAGKLPVDMLIFSGRSSSLQVIRDAVMDAIGKYNSNPSCRFVDVSSERFVTRGDSVEQSSISGLKSVVAAGALAYPTIIVKDENEENRTYRVRNRNIYATYGIMVHSSVGGEWQWFPLIDSRTRATKGPKSIHGKDISCYDSSRFNAMGTSSPLRLPLGNIDVLYVLQSYSTDTRKDWVENKKEMITILCCKTLENYQSEETVALKINENDEIALWIGRNCTEMLAHDDFYNTSFRKSMWPVVFSEKRNRE